MPQPQLDQWQVDSLRTTVFTSDSIPSTRCAEWWQSIAGTAAENMVNKPMFGIFSAEGPCDGGRLALNISPGRVDWLHAPELVPESMGTATLGKLVERDVLFLERLTSWLHEPNITVRRLAYGATLRFPVANRIEGYRALASLLPNVNLDPETGQDFLFQINRPRRSQLVNGLLINRLSKWASVKVEVGMLSPNANAVRTTVVEFVHVELDISSDMNAERDLNVDHNVYRLFNVFQELAREIASRGDIS